MLIASVTSDESAELQELLLELNTILKWGNHCLFYPLKAHQEARKAAIVSRHHQSFWIKHFQQNTHNSFHEMP